MSRELRPARIIAFLASAIVLASVVVAVAHTSKAGRHHAQIKSRVEQSHRGRQLVPAGPRLARGAAQVSISRHTSVVGHHCRAQFTYCKPGAQRTAAEVVVCRPAKRTHNQNSSLTPPTVPLKRAAGNDDPVAENSKIEATDIALLRAAQ